jgi:hypothetical protein
MFSNHVPYSIYSISSISVCCREHSSLRINSQTNQPALDLSTALPLVVRLASHGYLQYAEKNGFGCRHNMRPCSSSFYCSLSRTRGRNQRIFTRHIAAGRRHLVYKITTIFLGRDYLCHYVMYSPAEFLNLTLDLTVVMVSSDRMDRTSLGGTVR